MADNDDTVVSDALASVIRDHGWRVAGDPPRLRASLSDLLGPATDDHRGLVDALVVSAEEGTPGAVRDAGREALPERRAELVAALEAWGLTAERADWVLAAWTGLLPGRTDVPPDTALPPPPATELPTPTSDDAVTAHAAPVDAPGGALLGAGAAPTELPGAAPTELPSTAVGQTPLTPPGSKGESRPRGRRTWLVVAAAAVLVAGGTGVAVALSNGDSPTSQPGTGSASHAPAVGKKLPVGRVVLAAKADPTRAKRNAVMAGRAGGVRLNAFGQVPSVGSGKSAVLPADGGSLVAFTVADWCPVTKCAHWQGLGLHVAVGGSSRPLPAGGDTFVVSVPRGEHDVALVLPGGGPAQRLSLLDGRPGPDNITVLTRRLGLTKVPGSAVSVAKSSVSFVQNSVRTNTLARHVYVTAAELGYYDGKLTPTKPGDALVYVHAYFEYAGSGHQRLLRDEVHFQPRGAAMVAPIADPFYGGDGTEVYVFEVPGDMRAGDFVVGGSGLPRVIAPGSATSGVPPGTHYTLSLTPARIPVHLP